MAVDTWSKAFSMFSFEHFVMEWPKFTIHARMIPIVSLRDHHIMFINAATLLVLLMDSILRQV